MTPPITKDEAPLPCPFCWSAPEGRYDNGEWIVSCAGGTDSGWHSVRVLSTTSQKAAIFAWNTRSEIAQLKQQLAKAESSLASIRDSVLYSRGPMEGIENSDIINAVLGVIDDNWPVKSECEKGYDRWINPSPEDALKYNRNVRRRLTDGYIERNDMISKLQDDRAALLKALHDIFELLTDQKSNRDCPVDGIISVTLRAAKIVRSVAGDKPVMELAKVTYARDALQGLVNIDGRSELGLRHNPREKAQ